MIIINKEALFSMQREVDISKGIETGGILLGVFLKTGEILITHAIDPGPYAVKRHGEFQKDYEYSLKMLKLLYKKYSVDYLGEWHKHPNNLIEYSPKDRSSMINISRINSRPCHFIIAGDDYNSNDCSNMNIFGIDKRTQLISRKEFQITSHPEDVALEKGMII